MKFLIIIPAHNEEHNILPCLKSLVAQTHRDFKIVVVDDGSSDATAELVVEFAKNFPKISVLHREKSGHQPGAKVVQTFNVGLESVKNQDFDVLCKFDADIVFPKEYVEKLNAKYEADPKLGMCSGLVYISEHQEDLERNLLQNDESFQHNLQDFSNKEDWHFEDLSSKDHVRGPIKSYRKSCFETMGGLRPTLGWDNIDVMLAQMHGFKVITIKDVWVKHLRPTAFKYKNQKAEKLGIYFYNLGLNFSLTLISAAKAAWKSKSLIFFLMTMKSFLSQTGAIALTSEEIRFIRTLRWKNMFSKLR